ncbi:hypothetical protein [Spirosoma aerolatum]|uniref:hypothetical protein n=1 Tax=Spirosoma aerolatum TaxID=1211326 RepID=UPI0009AC0303|nr:hypothetical protein [Spirosoma aerolatum]
MNETPTTGGTNVFTDIIDILTGRKKPTASVETTVNIGLDQSSMINLAATALIAGTLLILISIGLNKLIK